ncbi:MAG: aromatic ring-hydroxylating dioxygenase subunit alpha [Gemmataceae bacterium]|nr:aromatic ring-hydroxylating dioxygenase subunit alpha [Gemmataceae bacterium]
MSDGFDGSLPLSRARTLPASCYVDPSRSGSERRKVFGDAWLLAGRADQVAKAGDWFALDAAGEPVVVVRGEEGTLRAFSNVCRHRGARVACGEQGHSSRLRCRYHGWTYALDGSLRGVPEWDGVEDFRREDHGLPKFHVGEWGSLVWVHLGTDPPPLDGWLAPWQRWGVSLEGLRWEARREYAVECDWKVYCDNYLDGGYHVNTLHPGLASAIDYSRYRTLIDDPCSVQLSPLDGDVRSGEAKYAFAFPHAMLNLYGGAADTNAVWPEGPGRCRVVFDFYFAADAGDDFKRKSLEVSHAVQLEDEDICREVQRGLGSRWYGSGRFSVKREGAGYRFHQLLAARLG